MSYEAVQHPFGPLRRKDREIVDRAEIDAILAAGRVMRLALSENDMPFLVPVFYGYDGTSIYFHSAKAGTKIRIMKKNPNICFEASLDHGVIESDEPCDFEARHRTVIGFGEIVFVEDEAEKIKALDMIVAKFSEVKFRYPKTKLKGTAVIRIDISSIKGKKHGF
jgi:uncharacterized protein